MQKTILLTGATDGIGFETAKMLVSHGHNILVHGRNATKLEKVVHQLKVIAEGGAIEGYLADLSNMAEVEKLAGDIAAKHKTIDVLINNAGVYSASAAKTKDGLDVRFAVNTIAPYLLTKRLIKQLGDSGRVVNLSSAAQFPVDKDALVGRVELSDGAAYAQSKLAIIMWSNHMVLSNKGKGPVIISVNPRSMLGSKMVKQAYGVDGGDLRIGADILCRLSLADEFADANGQYFDNDIGQFATPHPDALSPEKCAELVQIIESILTEITTG